MHLPCAPAPCTLLLLLLATAVAGLELAELKALKFSKLTRMVAEAGLPQTVVDKAMEAEDPKGALAGLLAVGGAGSGGGGGEDDAAARLAELMGLKFSQLNRLARELAVPKAALDVAMESEDPKTALAELLAGAGASGGSLRAEADAPPAAKEPAEVDEEDVGSVVDRVYRAYPQLATSINLFKEAVAGGNLGNDEAILATAIKAIDAKEAISTLPEASAVEIEAWKPFFELPRAQLPTLENLIKQMADGYPGGLDAITAKRAVVLEDRVKEVERLRHEAVEDLRLAEEATMTDGMKMFTVAALAAFDEEGRGPKDEREMREARAALKQQWTEHMGAEEHAQWETFAAETVEYEAKVAEAKETGSWKGLLDNLWGDAKPAPPKRPKPPEELNEGGGDAGGLPGLPQEF